jgi:membrane associated rhomboid family serine protease
MAMVIPLYDIDPLRGDTKPYVTYGLIAANIIVALVVLSIPSEKYDAWVEYIGFIPAKEILHISPLNASPNHLTVFSSMFLHADWTHLSFNMLFLWIFGDDIEEALGHLRFLVFYLLCGVFGAGIFLVSAPQSATPLVGASGAISGVMAAYLMIRPCAKVEVWAFFRPLAVPAILFISFFIAKQIWSLIFQSDDSVAYWDHLGGALAGAILVGFMKQKHVGLFECVWPKALDPHDPMSLLRMARANADRTPYPDGNAANRAVPGKADSQA